MQWNLFKKKDLLRKSQKKIYKLNTLNQLPLILRMRACVSFHVTSIRSITTASRWQLWSCFSRTPFLHTDTSLQHPYPKKYSGVGSKLKGRLDISKILTNQKKKDLWLDVTLQKGVEKWGLLALLDLLDKVHSDYLYQQKQWYAIYTTLVLVLQFFL